MTNESKRKKENISTELPKDKKEKQPKEKTIHLKESEFQKLLEEMADYRDRYIRLHAEFDNVRKRFEREKNDFVKYANANLIEQFLHIMDDLERSIEAARVNHQDYSAFLNGIEMVMGQIYEMLKKNNVKPIETKEKKFDPNLHEVLMIEETDEVEDSMVIEEFQRGYMLGDKVIRTSKVKVSKKKTESPAETPLAQQTQETQLAQQTEEKKTEGDNTKENK